MKQLLILTFCLLAGLHELRSQTTPDTTIKVVKSNYRRIVGLNMTPLITQLIPFNRSNPREAGPFLLRFKHYGPKMKSAFRFSMGLHLTPENGDFKDPQFSLALGWEKRRSISRRWSYTKGFDFMLLGGDLNVPGTTNSENVSLAIGPVFGMEYFLDPRISVGCEAVLALGLSLSEGLVTFDIIPPVGIFLNHYF